MKKSLVLLMLALLQSGWTKSVFLSRWEFDGGILVSNIWNTETPKFQSFFHIEKELGFAFGISSEIFSFNKLTLDSGIHYLKKAYSWKVQRVDEYGYDLGTITVFHYVDYVSATVLARYIILGIANNKLSLSLGPLFDLYLSNQNYSRNREVEYTVSDNSFSNNVYGLLFGIRMERRMTDKLSIFLDVRYRNDLSSLYGNRSSGIRFRATEILFGFKNYREN